MCQKISQGTQNSINKSGGPLKKNYLIHISDTTVNVQSFKTILGRSTQNLKARRDSGNYFDIVSLI